MTTVPHAFASNNPDTLRSLRVGLPDDPAQEMDLNTARRAFATAVKAELLADDARAGREATIACQCGLAGSGASETFYVTSPRTGRTAHVNHLYSDQLPGHLRGKIIRSTGEAKFTLGELTLFAEVAKRHAPPAFKPYVHRGRRW